MATRMSSQNFSPSPLCGTPTLHSGARATADYSSSGTWKDVKTELLDSGGGGGYQIDSGGGGGYGGGYGSHNSNNNNNNNSNNNTSSYHHRGSPQSLSSCMFSTHPAVSPSILHPLSFSERPHYHHHHPHHFMSGSKENSFFREVVPQCRRRLDFNHNAFMDMSKPIPVAVAKRNERERNRVKLINMTFQTLRQRLPVPSRGSKGKTRKLSKVQTLRSAIDYIRKLEELINDKKQVRQHFQEQEDPSSNSAAKLLLESRDNEQDRLTLDVADIKDNCVSAYGALYKPHLISSPGDNQSVDAYGHDQNLSSPENHYSTSSSVQLHEEPSPLSETSSYDVVPADEDEFLDFDFWF